MITDSYQGEKAANGIAMKMMAVAA